VSGGGPSRWLGRRGRADSYFDGGLGARGCFGRNRGRRGGSAGERGRVSLRLRERREALGLVGESGSGKSHAGAACLLGLTAATVPGRIEVAGVELCAMATHPSPIAGTARHCTAAHR